MTGQQLATAAEALVGSQFRLHGRDPATGLDCVGVLAAALAAAGDPRQLPNGYTLRSRALADTAQIAEQCGLGPAHGDAEAGDVVIFNVSPCQFHIALAAMGNRFIHAHAGLRRVVAVPGPLPWPIIQHWRLLAAA